MYASYPHQNCFRWKTSSNLNQWRESISPIWANFSDMSKTKYELRPKDILLNTWYENGGHFVDAFICWTWWFKPVSKLYCSLQTILYHDLSSYNLNHKVKGICIFDQHKIRWSLKLLLNTVIPLIEAPYLIEATPKWPASCHKIVAPHTIEAPVASNATFKKSIHKYIVHTQHLLLKIIMAATTTCCGLV